MSTPDSQDELERRRKLRAKRAVARRRRRIRRMIVGAAAVLLCLLLALALGQCGRKDTDAPEVSTDTTAPETSTDPTESGRVTITVTGDLLMHKPIIDAAVDGAGYDFTDVFSYIQSYVSRADLAVANLETTLAGTDNGNVYSGYPRFNCPDELVDAVKTAGFDLLLTANNHTYDTDAYGMLRTQEIIRDKGLRNLGTTMTADEPDYLVTDINGIRLGLICYTYGEIDKTTGVKEVNDFAVRDDLTGCINVFAYDQLDTFYEEMETQIAAMKAERAEAIVLFIHWGAEYQTYTTSSQPVIAQKMCDLGVDVIIGGHPHVIQPVDMLTGTADPAHQTLCVYSLGNALSNQSAENMNMDTHYTEDGMLFTFTLARDDTGEVTLESAQLLPTWVYIREKGSSLDYFILPLDTEISDWKAALDIGDDILEEAEASYERTVALTGAGMEEIESCLSPRG